MNPISFFCVVTSGFTSQGSKRGDAVVNLAVSLVRC